MAQTQLERYRQHAVWELIDLKRGALETVKYSQQPYEGYRLEVITMLDAAARSKGNPQATIYDDVLDVIAGILNQLSADEQSFMSWSQQSYMNDLRARVRDLPGPPPRQVNESYVVALDTAIAARQGELEELRASVSALNDEVVAKTKELAGLTKKVDAQHEKLTADAATISQVVATADEQLRREWATALATWEKDRETRDGALDEEMAGHVQLLSTAALTGRRLVEQAAGHLTAADWAGRAKRERWNAHGLRWASFVFFALAVVVGAWVLWIAIDKDLTLTVGDGILRGALVLALAGVGSFLTIEARRHFREADSAEDVKLALAALEPYYAGAKDDERTEVRRELGDTVFIKNTLSRFSSRDAAKHAGPTNEQLNQIVDLISKGADATSKATKLGGNAP
jgi:Skp family chaperone for outer membrane proteins